MLALTHQEAKTKEKEQANLSNRIRTNLLCHPEALLFRIWAWVSAKDGSMIWDGQRRTVLQSHQRVIVLKRSADLQEPVC